MKKEKMLLVLIEKPSPYLFSKEAEKAIAKVASSSHFEKFVVTQDNFNSLVLKLSLENRSMIYEQAIVKWGKQAQFTMLIEECGELISALCQFQRGRVSEMHVMKEAVDVELLLNQLKRMIGNSKTWYKALKSKVDRLKLALKRG